MSCLARLRKEVRSFEAPPYIRAKPLESNIKEWRYVLQGPPDSPYEGGMYQGKVRFPDDYPFKPPSIYMLTPNGRFKTDTRLCLSISDFHPESWVPTWSVATILNGVLSFMLEDTPTSALIDSIPRPPGYSTTLSTRAVPRYHQPRALKIEPHARSRCCRDHACREAPAARRVSRVERARSRVRRALPRARRRQTVHSPAERCRDDGACTGGGSARAQADGGGTRA